MSEAGADTPRDGAGEARPTEAGTHAADNEGIDGEAVNIELTHDVICPWCRIGHHRLKAAVAEAGRPVQIVYRPFFLDPTVPPEGVDLRKRMAEKYGAASLDSMFERVTQVGRADGLHFDFAKVTRTPNTAMAHALLEAAPAASKTALLDALHLAYFERGEDIGARGVLLAQWEAIGLTLKDGEQALDDQALRGRVAADAQAQSRAGVRGVPFFRMGASSVSGAQPVAVLADAIRNA